MKTVALLLLLLGCGVTQALAQEEIITPRTGDYSAITSVAELTDPATLESLAEVVAADATVEWEIYVPENYSSTKPAGIMVNISPLRSGSIPKRWKPVMDRHNLIWIGANRAGNPVMTMRRMLFAALAPVQIQNHYSVNTDRIFVSGLSGGGRVSSLVAIEFARQFKGAIYICGVNPPRQEQPVLLDQVRENRFVFLTGSKDFNKDETKRVFARYKKLGVEHIQLMVVPHMSHRNPDADDFEEAIRFLDDGLHPL